MHVFSLYTVVSVVIEGPNYMPLNYYDNFTLTCIVTFASEINDTRVQIAWADPNLNPFSFTNNNDIMLSTRDPILTYDDYNTVYTLSLNFSALQALQVGVYTCGAMLNDDDITVSSNFSVSVKGQYIIIILVINYFIYSSYPCCIYQ